MASDSLKTRFAVLLLRESNNCFSPEKKESPDEQISLLPIGRRHQNQRRGHRLLRNTARKATT